MSHPQAQLSIKPTQVMYLMKCIFNFQGPLGELSPIRSRLINFSPIRTGRGQVDTQNPKCLQTIHKKYCFCRLFNIFRHKKTPTIRSRLKVSIANLLFMYMIKKTKSSQQNCSLVDKNFDFF